MPAAHKSGDACSEHVRAAAERFVSIGGKFMLSPRGRIFSSIDRKLVAAYRAGAEDSRREFRAFNRINSQERARIVSGLVRRRGHSVNGWLVWERR